MFILNCNINIDLYIPQSVIIKIDLLYKIKHFLCKQKIDQSPKRFNC